VQNLFLIILFGCGALQMPQNGTSGTLRCVAVLEIGLYSKPSGSRSALSIVRNVLFLLVLNMKCK